MCFKHSDKMKPGQASDVSQAIKIDVVRKIGVNEVNHSIYPMALDSFVGHC